MCCSSRFTPTSISHCPPLLLCRAHVMLPHLTVIPLSHTVSTLSTVTITVQHLLDDMTFFFLILYA